MSIRTSKFIIAAMTPEERDAHFKARDKRSREKCREADNARRRARYAADPKGYLKRQQARIKRSVENQERRRATVRKSRYRKMWLRLFNSTLRGAKVRGLDFTLTKEWVQANYSDVCQLTGIPFVKSDGVIASESGIKPFSPSIDRVDPNRGYHPDNCIFVLWVVNKFKDVMSLDEMYYVAGRLVANRANIALPMAT